MLMSKTFDQSRPFWFVNATFPDVKGDFTDEFLKKGKWTYMGHDKRMLGHLRSMREGDGIAIKVPYNRKCNLPFDSRGHTVSVLGIKAVGIISGKKEEQKTVVVDWQQPSNMREWYFYTHPMPIWKVERGDWAKEALIDFAFYNKPQDIDKFRNRPYWYDRFGDRPRNSSKEETHTSNLPTALSQTVLPYSLDSILADGCFMEDKKLKDVLLSLKRKKNLILQGPPGTGKTWLAKRLAFALMGEEAADRLRAVQFHSNLSYEDFIHGWRPSGEGRLELVNGPFMEVAKRAGANPNQSYVMIIEEINRGNPAQIFGETLTLLEADKRNPLSALQLCYSGNGEKTYLPHNLYVIGTMNIADRSLALVDIALRRRFAFIDLTPYFGEKWVLWVSQHNEVAPEFLREMGKRICKLNEIIASDQNLGRQFQIGHSYFTPQAEFKIRDGIEWFKQIVDTEIKPLLAEYWYDDLQKVDKVIEDILQGG